MSGFSHILVPLDGTQTSELALGAAEEAAAHHGHITLLKVIDMVGSHYIPDEDDRAQIRDQQFGPANEYLEQMKKRMRRTDLVVDTVIASGPPADAILEVAAEKKASAISLCTHTEAKLRQFLLGSVSQRVMKNSPVPVIMVHPPRD